LEGKKMTPEDEEFNRIEMESRIKQEYIRAMRKTTREEKISRPAVYEVPANNRMIASHQDHVRRLMEELAIARVCIRELGDRLSKLEKTEQEPVAYINIEKRSLEWAYKYMSWDTPTVINLPKIPLYTTPQQRTWVGLTEDEIAECFKVTPDQYLTWHIYKRIEAKLKEKNNG